MKRMTLSFMAALFMTLGLFLVMESLVSLGQASFEKPPSPSMVEFIRLNQHSDLNLKNRELPKKEPPKTPPARPAMDYSESQQSNDVPRSALRVERPGLSSELGLKGGLALGNMPMDRDTVPIVRVEPMYPARAAQRRIEGWVIVEFSIGKIGTVKNVKVVDSEPGTVFDRAALSSVSKWKYKPRVDNGVAVATHGHQTKITFKLDN